MISIPNLDNILPGEWGKQSPQVKLIPNNKLSKTRPPNSHLTHCLELLGTDAGWLFLSHFWPLLE